MHNKVSLNNNGVVWINIDVREVALVRIFLYVGLSMLTIPKKKLLGKQIRAGLKDQSWFCKEASHESPLFNATLQKKHIHAQQSQCHILWYILSLNNIIISKTFKG